MANKTKKSEDGTMEYRKYGEEISFVLNNLDETDKAKLDNTPLDAEVLFQMHDKAHEMGFCCTTKFDAYSKCWQATLVCNGKGMLNVGLAVSGRSNLGVSDAMFVAYYKLFYVANGDLTKWRVPMRQRNTRG